MKVNIEKKTLYKDDDPMFDKLQKKNDMSVSNNGTKRTFPSNKIRCNNADDYDSHSEDDDSDDEVMTRGRRGGADGGNASKRGEAGAAGKNKKNTRLNDNKSGSRDRDHSANRGRKDGKRGENSKEERERSKENYGENDKLVKKKNIQSEIVVSQSGMSDLCVINYETEKPDNEPKPVYGILGLLLLLSL